MPETEPVKQELKPFDMSIIRQGGGDFEEYTKLPSEEPIEANITELKVGRKFNRTTQEDEDRLYVYAKVLAGEGAGQTYRGDFNPVITRGGSKQSNLSKFLQSVYGEPQDGIVYEDILGRPVRIELSEPWGDKGLQFIKQFKKPTSKQVRIDIAEKTAEDNLMDAVDQIFDGAEEV